jgi:Co/Zn/Cd efflux system component
LIADGLHARADGLTSLAVLLGAGGVAVGWAWADPVVGLRPALSRRPSRPAVNGRCRPPIG